MIIAVCKALAYQELTDLRVGETPMSALGFSPRTAASTGA